MYTTIARCSVKFQTKALFFVVLPANSKALEAEGVLLLFVMIDSLLFMCPNSSH